MKQTGCLRLITRQSVSSLLLPELRLSYLSYKCTLCAVAASASAADESGPERGAVYSLTRVPSKEQSLTETTLANRSCLHECRMLTSCCRQCSASSFEHSASCSGASCRILIATSFPDLRSVASLTLQKVSDCSEQGKNFLNKERFLPKKLEGKVLTWRTGPARWSCG